MRTYLLSIKKNSSPFTQQVSKGLIGLLSFLVIVSSASIAFADNNRTTNPSRLIEINNPSKIPQCDNQGPIIVPPCGSDEYSVIFDQPVYDDDGLFVTCFEKRPYCIPTGLSPEGDAVPGVDGVKMRGMVKYFSEQGHKPPTEIYNLAQKTSDDDPLADSTITCNDNTHVCTCISSNHDNECTERLNKLCTEASPFGANGGVGTGC